jgi:hypothetical protein
MKQNTCMIIHYYDVKNTVKNIAQYLVKHKNMIIQKQRKTKIQHNTMRGKL